jgi:PST family polysaccharide transporter
MMAMIIGCTFLSRSSFGTSEHAVSIALLGITILLGNIAAGKSCLMQGTRRISDLARVSIIGALNGTAISISCFYFWGIDGIVISLILTALAALTTSWCYARRIPVKPVDMSWQESRKNAVELLRFGMPLMLAGLMTTLSGYLIRILLIRQVGLDGVGIWQAAFNLSGILVNFVLSAMGADYYPRLTAIAHDNSRVREAVNTQTEIALLLAVPGLAATIIFAPLVITIFYSGKFDAAVDILRWSVYGIFGRIVSWPLGFVLLAKGMGKTFFCTEAFGSVFYIFAIWLCTHLWGLPGSGIAFLLLYVVYTLLVYGVAYAISRTTWNRSNLIHILIFGILLAIVGLISAFVAIHWVRWAINLLLLAAISSYSFCRLSQKSGITFRTLWTKIVP